MQTLDQHKQTIKSLINRNRETVEKAERNRKLRRVTVNIEELRARNLLGTDETLIPIRVIDANIKREQPSLMALVMQSYRAAIFKPRNPNINPANLEKAFTDGVRYTGWEIPFYKCIDGAQLHGYDAIELEYDDSKPFKIAFSHIGYENIIFQRNVHSLEDCSHLLIRYPGQTAHSLREKVQHYGFNADLVNNDLIKEENYASQDRTTYTIYKVYFKTDGLVYIAWYAEECSDWLKPPEPLWLGRTERREVLLPPNPAQGILLHQPAFEQVKVFETRYPVKLYIYKLSEEKDISKAYGRAFEDENKQVAQTALWTVFVNGANRASNVYGSPAGDESNGGPLTQLDVTLTHGRFYNKQVNFWSPPFPPIGIIDAAQRLDTQHQNEAGQVNYAILTRKDTEKTATELNLAKEQSNLLSTVQVTLLASFLRDVYSHTWLIVQSLALAGQIVLKNVPENELAEYYEIDTAGTTDVVERDQRLQRRLSTWSLVSGTSLAPVFLMDILKELFPQDAQRYEQFIQSENPKNKTIQGLMTVLQSIIMDDNNQIKPEYAQFAEQFTALAQQAAAVQRIPF